MSEPTYEVEASGKTCSFFCPKCRASHFHSLPEDIDKAEHRVAHCLSGESHPQGYWIVLPERSGRKERMQRALESIAGYIAMAGQKPPTEASLRADFSAIRHFLDCAEQNEPRP